MTIRKAQLPDLQQIMAVLDAARHIMRSDGNTGQWINGYPSEEIIRDDIENGYGYVVVDDFIVSYFAFIPSPEPTYNTIYEGNWLDDTLPYHVVHRIGSTPTSHGIFKTIMDWCFANDEHHNIKIDTHRDNRIMQHCIISYGFTYCGIIYLTSGNERLAYQKINQ
ncbi:MAG: N-acetyltransferase [Bacteroidales bacterium]|nr:N-acetyltransferase [Bacteroidales bacterium]